MKEAKDVGARFTSPRQSRLINSNEAGMRSRACHRYKYVIYSFINANMTLLHIYILEVGLVFNPAKFRKLR